MKKLFLAATVALGLLVSCSTEYDEILSTSKGGTVKISFVDEDSSTRAFFGTTASAESWEKALTTVTIFAFNSTGDLLVQRAFSASELSAKTAVFALPDVAPGSNCDFYAVANFDAGSVANKAALLSKLETSAASYNGTFAEVTAGAKRADGFVMSGFATKAIATAGSSTNVALTLKRTVAKVAFEMTPSPSFGQIYPGDIKVNSVVIKKGATQSPVIEPASVNPGAMSYTVSQNSNVASGKYQNLFYLFENGNLATGNRVVATINATYDADGNFSTTNDQSPMSYDVELSADSAGSISRNGYYRVAVTINGLTGSDVSLSISVAEWNTPVTQNIVIGA